MSHTRPEHEVLTCIARRNLDSSQQSKLHELLRQDLDWDYLLATAVKHGLIPLLHEHLKSAQVVGGRVLGKLKREAVENSQSVLHLTGKLLQVQRLFAEHDVRLAFLKGPVLSQIAYGELGLRRAGDIDVLIARNDFAKATELLESLGYQMVPALTPQQLRSHLGFHCEITFMRDDWFTIVDLHWGLAPKSFGFKLEPDEVLSRLQSVSIAGAEIQTFGTEDLILYLSMHGSKHLWRRFEWISSLSEVVRHSANMDWSLLIERADKAHGSRMLALGLHLVMEFSDVGVPADVLAALDADESMKRLAVNTRATFFSLKQDQGSTEIAFYNLKVMDRKRDALLAALRAIYTPTLSDFEAITLPSSLHAFYYAIRPIRLSKVYSTRLLRKLSFRTKVGELPLPNS